LFAGLLKLARIISAPSCAMRTQPPDSRCTMAVMPTRRERRHLALLFTAADTHADWEVIANDDGEPCAVRNRRPGNYPDTPNELAK
jgi:hypothetical protein